MKHRIGVIGYGGMGGWHVNKIATIENIELAGIWDIRECQREKACEKGIHVYESLEALLADETVDMVLIATPNDVHKPLAIAAMEAGKNVVCEKPVTLNSADLQEMVDASVRTGKVFTVHQNRRWDKDFLVVKKIIEDGTLGPIFRIESRVQGAHGIPGDWRGMKQHGGGMILDWGVHLLDQMLLIYPDAKIKSVYANVSHVTNDEVDDGFCTELLFDNGVRAWVEVGTSNFIELPRWVVEGVDGTALIEDFKRNGKIVCANGEDDKNVVPVATAAGLTKTMAPRREETIKTLPLPEVESDVRDFYRNLMAVIDGEAEIIVKLPQVQRVMRLMEAIMESATTGQVVAFEQ